MLTHLRISKSGKDIKGMTRQFTFNNSENEDTAQQIQDLENELRKAQAETKSIQDQLKESQDILVKKEQINKTNLIALEEKLRGRIWNNDATFGPKTLKTMDKIQEYHTEIQNRLGVVQHKTLQILVDQEKDLVKEYKDKFIKVESKLGTMKIQNTTRSKLPESKEFNLWQSIETHRQDHKRTEVLNDKLAEMNTKLKMDRAEQVKEIAGMKQMVDRLKIERHRLKIMLNEYRFSTSTSKMLSKNERLAETERKYEVNGIEKIKAEIEKSKKKNKDERLKMYILQESTVELKFLLKQAIQDINNKIHSVRTVADINDCGSIESLKEKNVIIGKLYDKAFPPRADLSRRMLVLPHNKLEDIEITMGAIQNLYETYEKSLKSKLL